jgi:hypothetical protein
MTSPYPVAANSERIAQLTRIASTPVFRSMPEGDGVPGPGLKSAQALLILDGLPLRFGDTDPIDQHRYVAAGGQIHLIGDGFWHHLIAPAQDYVSPRVLPDDFSATSGTLEGAALDDRALKTLPSLSAQRVVGLEDEITGRLLSLTGAGSGRGLRFLVSRDGRRWIRPDLRLVYLLADPPFWSLAEEEETASEEP